MLWIKDIGKHCKERVTTVAPNVMIQLKYGIEQFTRTTCGSDVTLICGCIKVKIQYHYVW